MTIDRQLQTELKAIAVGCGCELIHTDFRGGVLRLILDQEDGVTVDQCSRVSRQASALLDVADFGAGHYTLEVTSPGLDREFYSQRDYERFLGSLVKISWVDDDKKRTDTGRILAFDQAAQDGPRIKLELGDGVHTVELSNVVKTRLEPEF